MNLNDLIPNNDQNWSIKNNMIYYHNYCDIPVLQKRGGEIWIILDRRVTRNILKLTKHLIKLDIRFFYSSKVLNHNQDLTTPESKAEIIRNYLHALTNVQFFDNISKTGIDYIGNLTEYINKNGCWDIFKEEFEIIKKDANRKHWDYLSGKQIYEIKREDIRDFIANIEREIKLNMFL